MKYAFFFVASLFWVTRTQAQGKSTYAHEETRLKVVFSKSGITATYMNQTVPISNVQELDSLLKKVPDLEHQKIEYENQNADPAQSLAIIRTLEKCNCHLVTKSVALRPN